MAIKALEKELNVALFVRAGNYLTLSEAGKAVYKDCESLLITASRIRQTCAQACSEFAAEMWIARDDSLPDHFWQDIASQLHKLFPNTSLIWFWPPVAI